MAVWLSGYHASTLISSVEQHWNSLVINWGFWLIWVKKKPYRGYGRLLVAAALLMVLKLYLIVNYYYNTLFLFFLFIREVISLTFSLFWTFMHEKLFYDQSHHFQLEYRQQSIFLAYCCPFSFCINYHHSKASYLLFITIFTHFALNITIIFTVLSLISVLCLPYWYIVHSIALPSAPPLSYALWLWNPFSNWRGECMHYGIACDMITALCHTLLIWQHISIACIHKFFSLKFCMHFICCYSKLTLWIQEHCMQNSALFTGEQQVWAEFYS